MRRGWPFVMRSQFVSLTFLFFGSGVGTMMRYGLAGALRHPSHTWGFPLGALAVTVARCFAIRRLRSALCGLRALRDDVRGAMLVGVLGEFTTVSSFGLETMLLCSQGHAGRAIADVALSNLLRPADVWAGLRCIGTWQGVAA
ncbi:MAG: CrcB family protein [Leptolyngbya sp. PLA3]|nr:MAG: CrcB family protein [Cyanobacteria bacterium CYA]MCE7969060.1 CrcB family protein [Leptolyngbya sp. PL-A3]